MEKQMLKELEIQRKEQSKEAQKKEDEEKWKRQDLERTIEENQKEIEKQRMKLEEFFKIEDERQKLKKKKLTKVHNFVNKLLSSKEGVTGSQQSIFSKWTSKKMIVEGSVEGLSENLCKANFNVLNEDFESENEHLMPTDGKDNYLI